MSLLLDKAPIVGEVTIVSLLEFGRFNTTKLFASRGRTLRRQADIAKSAESEHVEDSMAANRATTHTAQRRQARRNNKERSDLREEATTKREKNKTRRTWQANQKTNQRDVRQRRRTHRQKKLNQGNQSEATKQTTRHERKGKNNTIQRRTGDKQ